MLVNHGAGPARDEDRVVVLQEAVQQRDLPTTKSVTISTPRLCRCSTSRLTMAFGSRNSGCRRAHAAGQVQRLEER
jgi:hypothetical protein